MESLKTLGLVGLGGAFGACARYLVAIACVALWGNTFPVGTLLVNLLGSLGLGYLMALIGQGSLVEFPWRAAGVVGFMGAFTTFSTFSMDNVLLLESGDWSKLLGNVVLNVVGCFAAAALGYQLGQGS